MFRKINGGLMEDEEALGRNKSIASIAVGNAVIIYVSTQTL